MQLATPVAKSEVSVSNLKGMSSFIAASKASDIRLSESQKHSQSFERHSRHDLNVGRAPFGFFYKQGHHLGMQTYLSDFRLV
ncbi:hypothetical protein CEXT_271631 [Caerostris extrusa]|uniref:Uncharacterized protein n=1 Tax=Caerostris extrusa TaxID=172846 RepID=A0AAV4YE43_CAEEX|nr:hypothetical protein CEXT_271631 [Caerostris extrusa]